VKMPTVAPKRLHHSFHRCPLFAASLLLALFSFYFLETSAAQGTSRTVVAKTAPTYPELARRMHVTGKVKLEVVITASGSVKSARLVGGSPVFEKNAVEAVKQWRFESAPTETKTVIVLEFADQ
jgi:TonB family protein